MEFFVIYLVNFCKLFT